MGIENNRQVEWIDIQNPTANDLVWLVEKFRLHPAVVEELRGSSARAHIEHHDGYLYFIYYFPLYDKDDATSVRTEIDFIVTKNAIVTVHYEPTTGVLDDFELGKTASSLELFYRLIQHLLNFEERQLRHVREKVEAVGREIFHDKEKEVLEKITYLKRDISEYRIIVKLQAPVLNSLLSIGRKFWGGDAEIYLNDLALDHLKIVNQLEDYRESVRDFEDTNNQLMNLKINSVMKTFTALSFLTFPFVLFATLFSMKTQDTPIVNQPHAFWIIIGIMAAGMVALAAYFNSKKWF